MSGEEGWVREIWASLSVITRRLDELTVALARLEPARAAPAPPGQLLDEAARTRLTGLMSVLAVGPTVTRDQALLLAVDRVVHLTGADCAAVFLVMPDGELSAAAHRGFTARVPCASPDAGIVGRALVDRESIRGGAVDHGRDSLLRDHALGCALAVPICTPAQPPLGVLFAGRSRPGEFDPQALDVMTLLADRLRLLLGSPPVRNEPSEATSGLLADLDLERTAVAVVREATAVLGAPAVALLLPDEGGLTVGAAVGVPVDASPLPLASGAIATTLRTREAWIPTEGGVDDTLGQFLGAPPQLILPLVVGDTLVALLAAGGPHPVAATALAPLLPRAAAAIRNARLYTETVAALAELRRGEGRTPAPAPTRDFANLLAVVLGKLAVVRERVSDSILTRELEVAEEAAWRAAEAVRGLLGFAPGHRAGTLTPLDIAGVVRAAVEHARSRWAARDRTPPEVRLDLNPLPPVRGSADELREVLDHLLENAAEASPDGGPITVRARWDGGARVEVVVEDRGAGMDDAVRVRALDPFFSTRGPGRLGLGLPVAHAIVARHRGELEIVSAPGLGTTVRVTLPTVAGVRRPGPGAAAGVAHVLVVEDEASVREALVEIVVQQGHVALTAGDGPEALAIAQQRPIDAVITDLALPGASGLEVARAVRRACPGTPVVLVTAWPGRIDARLLEEGGIDAVIEKPVGVAEVRAALAAALARRGARRP